MHKKIKNRQSGSGIAKNSHWESLAGVWQSGGQSPSCRRPLRGLGVKPPATREKRPALGNFC